MLPTINSEHSCTGYCIVVQAKRNGCLGGGLNTGYCIVVQSKRNGCLGGGLNTGYCIVIQAKRNGCLGGGLNTVALLFRARGMGVWVVA